MDTKVHDKRRNVPATKSVDNKRKVVTSDEKRIASTANGSGKRAEPEAKRTRTTKKSAPTVAAATSASVRAPRGKRKLSKQQESDDGSEDADGDAAMPAATSPAAASSKTKQPPHKKVKNAPATTVSSAAGDERETATLTLFAKWDKMNDAKRLEQATRHPLLALLRKPAEMEAVVPLLKLDTPIWPVGVSATAGPTRKISILHAMLQLHHVGDRSDKQRSTHREMIQLAIDNLKKYGYDFARVPAANKELAETDKGGVDEFDAVLLISVKTFYGDSYNKVLEALLSLPNVTPALLDARHLKPEWYSGHLSLMEECVTQYKLDVVTRLLQLGASVCVEPWSVKEILDWNVEFLLRWLSLVSNGGRLKQLQLNSNWKEELAAHGLGSRHFIGSDFSHAWQQVETDKLIKHIVVQKLADWLRTAAKHSDTSVNKALTSNLPSTSSSAVAPALTEHATAIDRVFRASNVLASLPHLPVLRHRLSLLQPDADASALGFDMGAWLSNVQAQFPVLLYMNQLIKKSNRSSEEWKEVFALHRASGRHLYVAEGEGWLIRDLQNSEAVKEAITPADLKLLLEQLEQLRGAELLVSSITTIWHKPMLPRLDPQKSSTRQDTTFQPLYEALLRKLQLSQSGQLDLVSLLSQGGAAMTQADARLLAPEVLPSLKGWIFPRLTNSAPIYKAKLSTAQVNAPTVQALLRFGLERDEDGDTILAHLFSAPNTEVEYIRELVKLCPQLLSAGGLNEASRKPTPRTLLALVQHKEKQWAEDEHNAGGPNQFKDRVKLAKELMSKAC